jgi:hypothetical protein
LPKTKKKKKKKQKKKKDFSKHFTNAWTRVLLMMHLNCLLIIDSETAHQSFDALDFNEQTLISVISLDIHMIHQFELLEHSLFMPQRSAMLRHVTIQSINLNKQQRILSLILVLLPHFRQTDIQLYCWGWLLLQGHPLFFSVKCCKGTRFLCLTSH